MAALAYILSGAAPVIKKFQFGVTLTASGIPFTAPTTTTPGVVIGTTTGATDLVGFSLDQGLDRLGLAQSTYTTTQGTGSSSAKRTVTLVINPDACWRMTMSGGATSGTALTQKTVTTASSGGTAITTADDWTSPQQLQYGTVWGFTGANAGDARKITSTSSTAGTVTTPFDVGTAVGDIFLRCPWTPMQAVTVQLTSDLTQADASISNGTGAPYTVVELVLYDKTGAGDTQSQVIVCANDHLLYNS